MQPINYQRESRRQHRKLPLLITFVILASFSSIFIQAAWAAPAAPTNLTASMASSKQINLSWTDNATNETSYYVERSPNGSSSWTVIATLGANVTSYQSTGLTQNTRYYYRVRCKAGSYSGYSNTANSTTATLAAPTALTAAVGSASEIDLTWADNTTYESNYYIERSPNGTSSWTVIATLGANVTTYPDTGRTVGTAYYYRVRAYDGTNYSAYSGVVSQTIHTIAASAGTNGTISPSGTVAVADGSSLTFTMTPNSGYALSSVTVDGMAAPINITYVFSNITANHTISAAFAVSLFTITASAGANGSISPSGAVAVPAGNNQTFTFTPSAGYHVSDVVVDGVSAGAQSSYTFSNVSAAHTIAVSFSNTYAITATANANGVITPSGTINAVQGIDQSFIITPNANYHISDVVVDGSSIGTPSIYTFPTVSTTHSIIASFAINIYTITATANANGSISPSGIVTVNSGGTQTFTITPNISYHVSDVQVDGSSVGAVSTYVFTNVTTTHAITASFATSLVLSNVAISGNNTINTALAESATIFYSINSQATVTLSVIPEKLGPTGTPVFQAASTCPDAGAYLFTWNGIDNPGRVVPDEAYLYILQASDGTSTYVYSPPAPTGSGTVNCSQSAVFNPATNQSMIITYTTAQASRVNINISWGWPGWGTNFTIMSAFPATPGSHTFEWDGKNPSNQLLDIGAQSSCSISSLLRENYIITTGDTPQVSALKTDPYAMSLSYGQFTRITYTLSRDSNVTVKIISPSGTVITPINNQAQTAGTQMLEWYGTDPSDPTGKEQLVSEKGDYTVSVQAVNPVTGSSSIRRANVSIGY